MDSQKPPETLIIKGNGGTILISLGGQGYRFTLDRDGLKIKEVAGPGIIEYKNFTFADLRDASAGQMTLFETTLKKNI